MTPGNLLSQTKEWLQIHGITITKRLGQHFLIDEHILERIINHADIASNEVILEIGAGIGTLTKALVQGAQQVVTIEKDPMLCQALEKEFESNPQIKIIKGDALKIEWPHCDKLVANLPYTISSPVIFRFLSTQLPQAILMLQQEFAQRLAANVGSKTYGRLTVMVNYTAKVELLEKVAPDCFYPQPAVSSALVRIVRRKVPAFTVTDYSIFSQLVTVLFNQRRKKIRTPLKTFLKRLALQPSDIKTVWQRVRWLDLRAEELTPAQIAEIANIISEER